MFKHRSGSILIFSIAGVLGLGPVARGDQDSKSKLDALRKDADAWLDLTRESFKLDCQAMEEMWSAYCEATDWEKEESQGADTAKAVADRVASARSQDGKRLLSLYDELRRRGESLKDDSEVGKEARELLEKIEKRRQGPLQKMVDGGAGRGYQHPLIQFAQRYGMERHLEMMTSSSHSCDVADEPIDGTGGRPDCISGDRCMIYEFKPDSSTGRKAFSVQEQRYRAGVNAFFAKHLAEGKVPSIRGGQQIYDKLLKNTSCWDAARKETKFDIEPRYYRVCEKRFECVQP
jgi:hypothetical protein